MFAFAIKKWFFDLWDNLFFVFVINVSFVAILAIPLILPGLIYPASPVAAIVVLVAGVLLAGVALAIVNRYTWDMARSERLELSRLPGYLKESWLPGLLLAAADLVLGLVTWVGLPFYASQEGLLSTIGLGLVVWLLLFWLIASQFFLPLNAQFEKRLPKLFRKSALLFMDNPVLGFGMLLVSLLILALSVLTLSLLPGITGLLLWHQVCLKLRMYKYDYLEAHPDAGRKHLPWDELLAKEREKIGVRTLRNLIFPWKD